MGLYDLHKNNTENTAFDTKTKTAPECNKKNSKDHQSEATALISCLNNDFICIVELFKAHGCDVTSDPNEIKIAYDTSWFSEYRVIKGDGVYLYREVSMGGYKLEKRLDCRDISTSFLILCADILLGMKYKKRESKEK